MFVRDPGPSQELFVADLGTFRVVQIIENGKSHRVVGGNASSRAERVPDGFVAIDLNGFTSPSECKA
jgi:hypothetical protein